MVSEPWPPFVIDDIERPGIDVEVMLAVFSKMQVDVEFRLYPWKRAINLTKNGEADAILDIFETQERRDWLWFPETPISVNQSALFCKYCDPTIIVSEKQMQQHALIVNLGYEYTLYTNNDKIIKYQVTDFEQGFQMLDQGRADYYLINRTVGLYTIKKMGLTDIRPLYMVIDDPSPSFLAFAKKKAIRPLLEEFDNQLKLFKASEDYRNILRKYGVD